MIPGIMLVVVLVFTAGLFVCAVMECWDTEAGEEVADSHVASDEGRWETTSFARGSGDGTTPGVVSGLERERTAAR